MSGYYTAFGRSRQTLRFDTVTGVGYIGRMTAVEPPTSATSPAKRGSRWPAPATLAGIVLVLVFAALYLFTLDDGLRPSELEGGDLITHQYAQVQGRPSNAPGYPLYTMGGWLWFHLGRLIVGRAHNPIPILASYSTLWALIAIWLMYRLILEVIRGQGQPHADSGRSAEDENRRWPIAAAVTAFYGLTYFFWYYAVTTEQYTSAVAWTLAVVLLAFRWERERRDGYLLALAFLMGVALAHMVTLLFIAPSLLWFVLRTDPKLVRRPRLMAGVIALALLPLLSYIYVYVRGAQHPEWRGAGQWASTGQWFLSFLSTRQGRDELTWSLKPFLTKEFPALDLARADMARADRGYPRHRGDRPAPGDHAVRDAGHLPGLLLDRSAGQLVPGHHAGVRAAGGRAGRWRGVALAENWGARCFGRWCASGARGDPPGSGGPGDLPRHTLLSAR